MQKKTMSSKINIGLFYPLMVKPRPRPLFFIINLQCQDLQSIDLVVNAQISSALFKFQACLLNAPGLLSSYNKIAHIQLGSKNLHLPRTKLLNIFYQINLVWTKKFRKINLPEKLIIL